MHRRRTRPAWWLAALVPLLLATTTHSVGTAHAEGNEAPGAPLAFRGLSSGGGHTCAVRADASLKCWGRNDFGQLGLGDRNARGDGPREMGNNLPSVSLGTGRSAIAVTTGGSHTCALLDNASVKCWGENVWGQLGRGDTANRGDDPNEMGNALGPVDLGPGRTATAVTTGSQHTCALLDNAAVKCWGVNVSGQLGQGDTDARGDGPGEMGSALSPVNLGSGRTATAIAAGGFHTCALLDDGSVKCWGSGFALGLGSTINRGTIPGDLGDNLAPVDLGPGRTATAVTADGATTCALLDNATVKCWGVNESGQLGLGDTGSRGDGPGEMGASLPAVDLGTGRSATAVATGGFHTCALLDDATVKCWGNGASGKLGSGDTTTRGDGPGEMGDNLPAVGIGTGRTVLAVTTGVNATCARLDDGSLRCWGSGGQLGLGDSVSRGDGPGEMGDALPAVPVPPTDIAPPANDAFANATTLVPGPSTVAGDSSGATVEPAEPDHVGAAGGASVWYRFTATGPGRAVIDTEGSTFDTVLAVYRGGTLGSLTEIARNDDHLGPQSRVEFDLEAGRTYRIVVDGRHGAAGPFTVNADLDLFGPLQGITQIAAGEEQTCAVLMDTTVRCWGSGALGNGLGLDTWSAVPVTVLDGSGTTPLTGVAQLAVGGSHNCAVLTDGTGVCWGENLAGALGDGTLTNRTLPVVIQRQGGGPLTGIAQISVGGFRSCARLTNGEARCWGQNGGGIGDGSTVNRKRPVAVRNGAGTGPLTGVAEIVTGPSATCARLTDRKVRCWGFNQAGILGDGSDRSQATLPRAVRNPANSGALTGATDIAHHGTHACVRVTGGEARCWGSNRQGQIGDGTVISSFQAEKLVPRAVLAPSGSGRLTSVASVGAGAAHSCAVLTSGQARCWGQNNQGQVGDGSTTRRPRARPVRNVADTAALTGVREVVAGSQHTCARLTSGTVVCWGANNRRQLGDGTSTRGTTPVRVLGV